MPIFTKKVKYSNPNLLPNPNTYFDPKPSPIPYPNPSPYPNHYRNSYPNPNINPNHIPNPNPDLNFNHFREALVWHFLDCVTARIRQDSRFTIWALPGPGGKNFF